MAKETWKFVQAKSKQAMKQVVGIREEKTCMKVTPPLAVAPITQEDDMRWNPNDDGIVVNIYIYMNLLASCGMLRVHA